MTDLIEDTRMNRETSKLVRQFEQDNEKTKRDKIIPLYEISKAVAGYIHAREALKKLKGLPHREEHLRTGAVNEYNNFPSIDINGILDVEGIWHYEDSRFNMDHRSCLDEIDTPALIDAVSPINTYNHAYPEYSWLGKFMPEEKPRTDRIVKFIEEKGKELSSVQMDLYDKGKRLNDGTVRYLSDENFLRAAVQTARMNLEGVFAKYQAKIDTQAEMHEAKRDGKMKGEYPQWLRDDFSSSEFTTGIIRHLYAPIVSETVPEEDKPYEFTFVDKKYLEERVKQ